LCFKWITMIYRKCFEVVGYFITKFYPSCNSASPFHLYRLTAIKYWKRNPPPQGASFCSRLHNGITLSYWYIINRLFSSMFNVHTIAKSNYQLHHVCLYICLSVCPSTWNNSAPTGWIFIKFDMSVFQKSIRKLKFH
jgi:hypothetical protein